MRVVTLPRGGGKTTEAIRLAAEGGLIIVVPDEQQKRHVAWQARQAGAGIALPVTWREVTDGRCERGRRVNGYVIDNLDMILAGWLGRLARGVPVVATSPPCPDPVALAAWHGLHLVTTGHESARAAHLASAGANGCPRMPFPLEWEREFLAGSFNPQGIKGFVFDRVDVIIQGLVAAPVIAATATTGWDWPRLPKPLPPGEIAAMKADAEYAARQAEDAVMIAHMMAYITRHGEAENDDPVPGV